VDEPTLLAEGREAEVFLRPDGTVLKLLRDPAWASRAEREAAALRTLRDHGHAAPAVVDVVTVDGRPGLVLERIEGDNLLALLGHRPQSVLAVARATAVVHLAMHDCPAPGGLPDLHDEVHRRLDVADLLAPAADGAVRRMLDGLPRGDRLCHGDLHPGNILGSLAAPAVIDWGDATRGDPVGDVARTVVLHRFAALPPGSPSSLRALAGVGRRLLVGRYLATYRRSRPVGRDALDRWIVVRAAARLGDPVPDEHPHLLRFVQEKVGTGNGTSTR
jgi:aminoglycoside phosphotransferase (APT) family kinase protein